MHSRMEAISDLDADDLAGRILDASVRLAVVSAGLIRDAAWRIGPRCSDGHVFHAVLAGGQHGVAGGAAFATAPGDALWIPAGTPHQVAIDRSAGRPRILRLRCRFVPDPLAGHPVLVRRLPLAAAVLERLIHAAGGQSELRAGLALLVAGMAGPPPAAALAEQRCTALRRLLIEDPGRAWTPALAAAALGCTGLALSRSLRAATGLPVRRWLLDVRLHAAMGELEDGAAVAEAARRHGWRDPFLFSRQFRARFGVPPTRWRLAQIRRP